MPYDNVTSALIQIKDKWESGHNPSFENLSDCVLQPHHYAQTAAIRAVNQFATLRNWLIGCYIVEYEQKGKDRAQYGERLLKHLEETVNCRGLNETLFKVSRLFYMEYPQIRALFDTGKSATVSHESEISAMPSHQFMTPPEKIVSRLSFSHIREIMTEKDPLGRFFYETECIRGCWSVKELRRQIATNLYFRSGISKNPQILLDGIDKQSGNALMDIRQPFTFEFLGLDAKEAYSEKDLEQPFTFEFLGLDAKEAYSEKDLENSLLVHLEEFLLELGKGFCFEARQKRIIIDEEYYFADLVFYHRILHCNVICELKNDEFKHEYLGQLNAYVS